MSTKINVRSPFYLNLTEPTAPTPLFTCDTANILNLSIDQQGQINQPTTDLGTILSITSSDSDFSNDKFATVSTATDRTITVRVSIPAGYSNTTDGYIDCDKVIQQPALVTSGSTPSCTGGVSASGSIPAVSIDVDGDSTTVDLSSYFTSSDPISSYSVYIGNNSLVNATVSSNTLTIFSNAIAGSTNIIVSATDGGANTCTASQSIAVTVNASAVNFGCGDKAFVGGSITQAGVITKPNSVAAVGTIRTASGDSSTNITSYPPNNTGSTRPVTLYFDLTAPAGFANAGATVECPATFNQPASIPAYDCEVANLSEQRISKAGIVDFGKIAVGTILSHTSTASDFSNGKFAEVFTATDRTVTFTLQIPAGYSNSGTFTCNKTLLQPATASPCGTNNFKLSTAKSSFTGFCDGRYSVVRSVTSTATSVLLGLGRTVCQNNAPFSGGNFYYAVSTNTVTVGKGTGKFYMWQIDDEGIIQDVRIHVCPDTDPTALGDGGSL